MAKFCSQCGAELLVDAKFCVYCGSAIANPRTEDEKIYTTAVNDEHKAQGEAEKEKSGAEAQGASFTPPPVNERPVYHAEPPKKVVSKSDAITSMVFGILSIFMGIFALYPFAGFFFMGASIAFIIVAKKKRKAYLGDAEVDCGFSRAGKITSTVAIPVLSFFSIYGLAFTIAIILTI
ncbi:MAG: zinc ribbon domain-containing protein [Ruminococcaceae bacterium]|nr:zinc ribbon domain-containing protein [Oscillospiraceae bacterium]